MRYLTDYVIYRTEDDGSISTHNEKGNESTGSATFPIMADVEVGDVLERSLPNGKTKKLVAKDVTHFESPQGTSRLNHIRVLTSPTK